MARSASLRCRLRTVPANRSPTGGLVPVSNRASVWVNDDCGEPLAAGPRCVGPYRTGWGLRQPGSPSGRRTMRSGSTGPGVRHRPCLRDDSDAPGLRPPCGPVSGTWRGTHYPHCISAGSLPISLGWCASQRHGGCHSFGGPLQARGLLPDRSDLSATRCDPNGCGLLLPEGLGSEGMAVFSYQAG